MSNRLQRLKYFKLLVGELKEYLADESCLQATLQIMSTIRFQIKSGRTIGRQGGSLRWTVHIGMLICELLVNGTPPSSIPDNIQTISAALTVSEVNELPSLDYVCKCFIFMKSLNGVIASCRIVKAENWHQIFTDGTTQRQIKFQNLAIGLMTDGNFESVIASSCIFL